jgi:hypothetical protein
MHGNEAGDARQRGRRCTATGQTIHRNDTRSKPFSRRTSAPPSMVAAVPMPSATVPTPSATVPMLSASRRRALVEYFSDQFMYRSGPQIIEDFVQVDGTGLPKV